MTTTYTYSNTSTFTRTHAKYLASKIAADLLQMQLFYGKPSNDQIIDYIDEIITLLLGGYLESVDYGFRCDGEWIIALRYEARFDGTIMQDDRSGRVVPGIDLNGASWGSYLRKNSTFFNLLQSERQAIEDSIPVNRTSGEEPQTVNGIWMPSDKSYSSNGVGVRRQIFKPL